MKKFLALLSLTAFLAVSVNAQTSEPTAPAAKKETVSKSESKGAACCVKANPSCCKSGKASAKACTPEQMAACAKAGHTSATSKADCNYDHSKAMSEKGSSEKGSTGASGATGTSAESK